MNKYFFLLLLSPVILFISVACPDISTTSSSSTTTVNSGYTPVKKDNALVGDGVSIFHIDTNGKVELEYTLDLGSYQKDVYFVFSNASLSDSSSNPEILRSNNFYLDDASFTGLKNAGLRGKPSIDKFNENPYLYLREDLKSRNIETNRDLAPTTDVEGDRKDLYTDVQSPLHKIPATCRKVVKNGTKTLNVWVADNCWGTTAKKAKITKDMVDLFSDKFLSQTDENIYKWITNIYGEEWGEHSNSDLIPDDDNITIFLCDIDEDNKRDGGVLGFFYAKDNFYRTKYDFSNQRIMFYIDAVLFAEKEGISWDISDKWPMQCISTLAHEFQHMIHFYQKSVLKTNKNSETFLNEMCSLISEDFVADKLQTDGPRGVDYNIGGAGDPGNKNGRLPLFNYYNGSSLTNFGNGTTKTEELMKSYAICYSFAAYIARNFGGALLFKNIVQNDKYDYRAIDEALKYSGFSDETFFTLIQKWGASVLLSDIVDGVPEFYRYNAGSYFKSSLNNVSYNLGSINLFNYVYGDSYTGPFLNKTNLVGEEQGLTKVLSSSNVYYLLGQKLSGKITKKINLDDNVKLTVVVK